MVHFFNIENSKLESVLAKRLKEYFLFVSKIGALGGKVVLRNTTKIINFSRRPGLAEKFIFERYF